MHIFIHPWREIIVYENAKQGGWYNHSFVPCENRLSVANGRYAERLNSSVTGDICSDSTHDTLPLLKMRKKRTKEWWEQEEEEMNEWTCSIRNTSTHFLLNRKHLETTPSQRPIHNTIKIPTLFLFFYF